MKKLLILVAILCSAYAGYAQRGNRSILKVRLTDDSPITISIDGRYYNKHGRALTIGDLPRGKHRLKIYEYNDYRHSDGGSARTLYSGTIKLEGGMVVSLTYDPASRDMRVASNYLSQSGDDNVSNVKGEDERKDVYNDDSYKTQNKPELANETGMTGRLATQELTDLQAQVAGKVTDTDKDKLMRAALENRSYSTEQVKTMLGWLSFESTKVDFAKWAYKYVSDRQNYAKLEKLFTYTSSKEEFNNYIKSQ